MLTMVTEVFGVHGETGNMVICPKLVKEQFDTEGNAGICLYFAGKKFNIIYKNPQKLDYGEYIIKKAFCDKKTGLKSGGTTVFMEREQILGMSSTEHQIEIELGSNSK